MPDAAQHRNSEGSTRKDGAMHQEYVEETEPVGIGESSSSSAQRGGVAGGDSHDHVTHDGGRKWWNRRKKVTYSHTHFKVYKRRWFGLAQLVLLNIVVSWDVSCGGW